MKGTLVYGDATNVANVFRLNCPDSLLVALYRACIDGGATVLKTVSHRFHPQGVTVVAVLAESHAAVHTYPEHSGYMLDVFTCGDKADALLVANSIADALGGRIQLYAVERGTSGDARTKAEVNA